jgi:hypothetical protein
LNTVELDFLASHSVGQSGYAVAATIIVFLVLEWFTGGMVGRTFLYLVGTLSAAANVMKYNTRGFAVKRAAGPIQEIFDSLCRIPDHAAAAEEPASCSELVTCLQKMNELSLEELGIKQSYIDTLTESQCMHVINTRQFDITAFLIPPGCQLPLHDHPHMAVLSKVVYGDLKLRSYSADTTGHAQEGIPVTLVQDKICTPTDGAWYLTPSGT